MGAADIDRALRGLGDFTIGDRAAVQAGESSLLVLDPEEPVGVRAIGGDLIFLEVLHGTHE